MMRNDEKSESLDLLTAKEVVNILKISKSFAYQLMNSREIPTIHIGRSIRVRKSDLIKMIEINETV